MITTNTMNVTTILYEESHELFRKKGGMGKGVVPDHPSEPL
jgi:hypothetical protein